MMQQRQQKFDLTSFGESMLRLSPPSNHLLESATTLEVNIAGAEGNVISALSQLDFKCGWMGGLPDSDLGRKVVATYKSKGVEVLPCICPNTRLGLLYFNQSPSPIPSKVIYDRQHSAQSQLTPEQLDWDFLLNTRGIHLTGITASLSASNLECVKRAINRAREEEIIIGFDVNYRALLWDKDTASKTLLPLLQQSDFIVVAYRDIVNLFNGDAKDLEKTLHAFSQITGCRRIAMTNGAEGAIAIDHGKISFFDTPKIPIIIDRIGAGDAFAAGVWSGILTDNFLQGVENGIKMASYALTQIGDITTITPEELKSTTTAPLIR